MRTFEDVGESESDAALPKRALRGAQADETLEHARRFSVLQPSSRVTYEYPRLLRNHRGVLYSASPFNTPKSPHPRSTQCAH